MSIVTFNTLGRYGRLCNQMYQIAGVIGIARKNGYDWALPYWNNYDQQRYDPQADIDIQKHFVNPLPVYEGPELPEQIVPWGYHDVRLSQSVSLDGHLQSFKYFAHCFDEVKHYFGMVEEHPQNDYCAIHVRRGDYDNGFHPRIGPEYYEPAMERFSHDQKYLVFSDDIEGAKRMLGDRVEYSEGRDYIEDFKLMKSCRHFIVGNSSYSAMAAVLGESPIKRVIAPRPWFGPKFTDITADDIYNEDWEVIEWERGERRNKSATP